MTHITSQANAALVIPTCRIDSFREFVDAWSRSADWQATFVVVDDAETEPFRQAAEKLPRPVVVGWTEIERDLENEWIISRQDSAIRSYGFLVAYRDLENFDLICTLDDDCFPLVKGHAISHRRSMEFPAWQSTLDQTRVRGLPFSDAPKLKADVNIGLWEGVFDLSSIDQLANGPQAYQSLTVAQKESYNRVIPQNVQVPMCGMNLAFSRRAAPLMYFGLQGRSQPVGRFDDIWCGVIAKKICDHLGWSWTCGRPIVEHQRASNPFANLTKEAPGIVEHEHLMPYLTGVKLTESSLCGCFSEMAEAILKYQPVHLPTDYFRKLGRAMNVWINQF